MPLNISYKQEKIILGILILIILVLIVRLHIHRDDYECSKCNLTFVWKQRTYGPYANQSFNISVPVEELYESYLNDECILRWEKTQGFVYKEKIYFENE